MIDGYVHPDFAPVATVFRQQLARTTGGASVAIYHRGELVVDLWGGTRTLDGDPWQADTMAMCFSTTKGIASLAVHLLADRGQVHYDAPVAEYWPEFAQNGKEGVTVRHVLTHSAGLHRLRSVIDHAEQMLDWDYMVDALGRAKPAYPPGTANGYHALTYGWLAGEIVRRVSGRPFDQFVQDEIVAPLELDGLYMGCPEDQRHRVAPLAPMGGAYLGPQASRRIEKRVGEQFAKLGSLTRFPLNTRRIVNALAPRGVEDVLFDAKAMDASIPAANGFMTARSLARAYGALAGRGTIDGVQLLSPFTVERIAEIQSTRRDLVLVLPMRWRLGYHAVVTSRGFVDEAFGHFGFGGSGGWCDPTRDLAVGMTCNRGTGTPVGDARLVQLGTAAMQSVRNRKAGRRGARRGGSLRVAS
ncbi:MAG: beta-lactamase family protein [Acidimicrobiales bacterium]|jgi:CubicO group peptidase (beta-lactamase class C family)|nr:beta-lactamase family protein [Acidimicrobiales bacterium]